VGQNAQGAASDKRAQATYDDTEALLHINEQIQAHIAAQDAAIVAILDRFDIPHPTVGETGDP
jgi:ATP-dependent Clp protease ATP-binding subunit ClpA